jgi:hypothetical protein
MLTLLAEQESANAFTYTVYMSPDSQREGKPLPDLAALAGPNARSVRADITAMVRQAPESGTGTVLFLGESAAMAVAPPFPVGEDAVAEGFDPAPLVDILTEDLTVGVVLLRLGRYAVGVVRREKLVASKSGSRYVKNRHRKGGSSQHRFERSRQRLVRELFDKACQTARDVFEPGEGRLDYLLLGGERHTVADFEKRCGYFRRCRVEVLRRRLEVDRPGKVALEKIHREVWKSRVYEFSRGVAE